MNGFDGAKSATGLPSDGAVPLEAVLCTEELHRRPSRPPDYHEAASVFDDSLALTFDDPDHSVGEQRLLTFGESVKGRLLAQEALRERVAS